MKTQFKLIRIINVEPSVVYNAWLNSNEHSKMTGGEAQCDAKEGVNFSAWNGYISGVNVKLTKNKEIIQKWRTSEFSDSDEDSEIIIKFKKHAQGTELILIHKNIPDGNSDYEKGWDEHYFEPMNAYFK